MANSTFTVTVADRPYVMTFSATGTSYPLHSEEVRRLVAAYPVTAMNGTRLVLRADDGQAVVIRPSTLGGGRAFTKVNRS